MTWKIEFLPEAEKDLKKIDSPIVRRILTFLKQRISRLEDPRSLGEALKGPKLGKYWKYRIGNYRIICRIKDKEILILVISIGHRKSIYRT
jgi:mRNA interferase RelE/StbE